MVDGKAGAFLYRSGAGRLCRPTCWIKLPVRAALAEDECEGNDRMVGASSGESVSTWPDKVESPARDKERFWLRRRKL